MIAQFSPVYFAQKTLIAALLDRPVSHIQSVTVAADYAIVQVKGQPYPYAIALVQLEAEHDRQRLDRGQALTVEAAPDGWDVTGGDEPHYVFPDPESEYLACDCHDYQRQHEAGRDRPYCKHIAAVELSGRKSLDDLAVIAAGELAKADLGW